MSQLKLTFALVLVFGLSACAMEVASGEGPAHDPGVAQKAGGSDVQLKAGAHAQVAPTPTAGPTGPGTKPGGKPKGDPPGMMDRPQPEPWDPTSGLPPPDPTH